MQLLKDQGLCIIGVISLYAKGFCCKMLIVDPEQNLWLQMQQFIKGMCMVLGGPITPTGVDPRILLWILGVLYSCSSPPLLKNSVAIIFSIVNYYRTAKLVN